VVGVGVLIRRAADCYGGRAFSFERRNSDDFVKIASKKGGRDGEGNRNKRASHARHPHEVASCSKGVTASVIIFLSASGECNYSLSYVYLHSHSVSGQIPNCILIIRIDILRLGIARSWY
jgi:hypothetical protein